MDTDEPAAKICRERGDEVNMTVDISGFNRGMTGFVDKLGIEGPVVLKKEMGELLKTLVKLTPGADIKKIQQNISGKFNTIADDRNSNAEWAKGGGKVGASGILWYAVDSNYLSGIAPEKDMRGASVEQLKPILYRITKSGHRLNLPIKDHPHQRALIYQTILTKASTVKKLIAAKIKNRGRLKAGWLAAWDFLSPRGGNQPPAWVMRHKSGARGWFQDGLGVKGFPTFTIANAAVGVGNKKNNVEWIARKALDLRAKAMKVNLMLFMRGKKHLSDYVRA